MVDRFLKVQEIAELLSCHEHTVLRLIQTRRLGALKLGKQWRVRQSELDRYLQIHQRPAASESLPRPLRRKSGSAI
jgi:excisionase family DNA binding protein